jgi:hypothetical protein
VDRGEYTRVRGGVVGGTRVGDPLWSDRRCQAHGVERASQGRLVPSRNPRRGAGGSNPRRRSGDAGRWSTSEHGCRWARRTSRSVEGPHRDAP